MYLKNRKIWFWVRVVIGAGLLLYLVFSIQWISVWDNIKNAETTLLTISALLWFPGVYLSCVKWRLLLSAQAMKIPITHLYEFYLIGSFFNNFAPSTIGHDSSRVYYTSRKYGHGVEVTSSIIVERATGIIAIAVLGFGASFLNLDFASDIDFFFILGTLAGIAILALLLVYVFIRISKKRVQTSSTNKIPDKIIRFIVKLYESFLRFRDAKLILVYCLFLSFAFQLLVYFSQYLLFRSFNLDVTFGELLFTLPIINLISMLPISINGWGIREGTFVLLFTQLGLASEDALTVALVSRALLIITSISGAFFLLRGKKYFSEA